MPTISTSWLTTWFAHPWALWLLLGLPSLALLALLHYRRKQILLGRFANRLALRSLLQMNRWSRFLMGCCLGLGLILLIIGMAGPRWGLQPYTEAAAGRDIVVVLDLSKSMIAEKEPSRSYRARQMLKDLAMEVKKRGGHRLGLVVFAGQARVVCPLTRDYDHFLYVLKRQDAELVPPELRPDPETSNSGTRIGAGLGLAAELHDPQYLGSQDILLVSDGDDPVKDEEWLTGVTAARERLIPVDVMGVGDPNTPRWIPWKDGFLEYQGKTVKSQLQKDTLEEIARRTQGTYIPAHSNRLPLGQIYQEVLLDRQARGPIDKEGLPIQRLQYGWFLGLALMLFTIRLLMSDGRAVRRNTSRFKN